MPCFRALDSGIRFMHGNPFLILPASVPLPHRHRGRSTFNSPHRLTGDPLLLYPPANRGRASMDRGSSTPLWKIVLGVALGVLLADLVRMAWMALAVGTMLGAWGASFDNPGKITEVRPRPAPAVPAPSAQPSTKLGPDRACINGVIAEWRDGKWSQVLADGSVRGCRSSSQ